MLDAEQFGDPGLHVRVPPARLGNLPQAGRYCNLTRIGIFVRIDCPAQLCQIGSRWGARRFALGIEGGFGVQDQVLLSGVPGSPYTRKMLAVLRYRRIPYRLILTSHDAGALPRPKVRLLPTFYFPDDAGDLQAVTDSTPIIRRLEREHAGRSVRPSDPALALIDALIEDFGDEWLTKAMFHYRWAYEADAQNAANILPNWSGGPQSDASLAERGAEVARRQIERLRYVGSNPTTGPIIEASYIRFIELFEAHLKTHRFLLGARPAAADFAAFGQLTQLTQVDPTPEAVTRIHGPRVIAWVGMTEDLCGHEPGESDWFDAGNLPATLKA
ncbi:MAG: glutathione S-transferase, partial [Caulobacteraceae bacterium]|nr:glutathione S-transferase [Caulobacteraceae bacterium]